MTEDQKAMTTQAASVVGSVAADLQAAAVRTFDQTVAEVKSQASDAKSNMADEVKDVAMALRRASEDLRGGSAQERTLGQIASTLADASDALRDKDLGEIMQAASRVARDNPVLFLSGAALLGFAASRFAKASSDRAKSTGQHGGAYGFVSNLGQNTENPTTGHPTTGHPATGNPVTGSESPANTGGVNAFNRNPSMGGQSQSQSMGSQTTGQHTGRQQGTPA